MIACYEESGRIINVVTTYPPGYEEMLRKQGERYVRVSRQNLAAGVAAGDVLKSYYVAKGRLTKRPACPAIVAVSGNRVTVRDVPEGSTLHVQIEGMTFPLDDFEFEVDEPGHLRVIVRPPWPMMEALIDAEIE